MINLLEDKWIKVTPIHNIYYISDKDLQISQPDKNHKAWKMWFGHGQDC